MTKKHNKLLEIIGRQIKEISTKKARLVGNWNKVAWFCIGLPFILQYH